MNARTLGFGLMLSAFASIFLSAVTSHQVSAKDYMVNEIQAIDGTVQCFARRDLVITSRQGPCDAFAPPSKIEVGQTFSANGKLRTIRVIQASQADKDMKGYGLNIKKGEWNCVAVESTADLDLEHNDSALWLYIPKCQPVAQAVSTIEILSVQEFLKLPEAVQSLFIGGIIEGMSFVFYGYSMPDYAAWVECVRSAPLGDTTKYVITFLRQRPDFKETIASALAQTFGQRCKHGNG